jgi:WD40 repeat protein
MDPNKEQPQEEKSDDETDVLPQELID